MKHGPDHSYTEDRTLSDASTSTLAASMSEVGGFGFLGLGASDAVTARQVIRKVQARTARPFGVNLLPASCVARRADHSSTAPQLHSSTAPQLHSSTAPQLHSMLDYLKLGQEN
ncbi:nitronate monooxygenase [Nguyenibacter vanlangensis]|uniref:nitronate monooxygenase n=1 Tax=Nguyenibacter vanlangensis TaxID=1216886 RepID=UPI0038D1BD14